MRWSRAKELEKDRCGMGRSLKEIQKETMNEMVRTRTGVASSLE